MPRITKKDTQAEEPASDFDKLMKLTVTQIKALMSAKPKLSQTGRKDQLVRRWLDALAAEEEVAEVEPEPDETEGGEHSEEAAASYEGKSSKELIALLKERGLPTYGSNAKRIERLQAADAVPPEEGDEESTKEVEPPPPPPKAAKPTKTTKPVAKKEPDVAPAVAKKEPAPAKAVTKKEPSAPAKLAVTAAQVLIEEQKHAEFVEHVRTIIVDLVTEMKEIGFPENEVRQVIKNTILELEHDAGMDEEEEDEVKPAPSKPVVTEPKTIHTTWVANLGVFVSEIDQTKYVFDRKTSAVYAKVEADPDRLVILSEGDREELAKKKIRVIVAKTLKDVYTLSGQEWSDPEPEGDGVKVEEGGDDGEESEEDEGEIEIPPPAAKPKPEDLDAQATRQQAEIFRPKPVITEEIFRRFATAQYSGRVNSTDLDAVAKEAGLSEEIGMEIRETYPMLRDRFRKTLDEVVAATRKPAAAPKAHHPAPARPTGATFSSYRPVALKAQQGRRKLN